MLRYWVIVVVATALVSTPAYAAENHIRKRVSSLTAAEIQELRDVVSSMMKLPIDNQRGWLYQAAAHDYLDSAAFAKPLPGFTPEELVEMKKYALAPPEHAVQNDTWKQCHQTQPDRVFLLWHRVYLYYFERMAREVSGKPSFALPYWDYTKGTTSHSEPRKLPESFREETYTPSGATEAIPNPLFAPRLDAINEGRPLRVEAVSIAALDEKDGAAFAFALENVPHNAVHAALGKPRTGLLMGATVWAAQDPIFWLHHSNIDRLWSCWQKRGRAVKHEDDGTRYKFIDENGSVVSHSVTEMEAIAAAVDYEYEEYSECSTKPDEAELQLMGAESRVRISAFATQEAQPIELDASTTSVPLALTPKAAQALSTSAFTERPENFSARLHLHDIEADSPVGVMYIVSIRKQGSAGEGTKVGSIAFFPHGPRKGQHEHHEGGASLEFDVEDALRQLGVVGVKRSNVEVLFVPISPVEGGPEPTALLSPDSRPRVGSLSLEIEGPSLPALR